MELSDYLKQYNVLKNIKRFHMECVIQPQNLCDHGYNVATVFYIMCKELKIEVTAEEMFAVMNHDFAETFTGDLNRVVKERNETTAEAWDIIEQHNLPSHLHGYTDQGLKRILDPGKMFLFKFADCVDAYLYCKTEVNKGNRFLAKAKSRYLDRMNNMLFPNPEQCFDEREIFVRTTLYQSGILRRITLHEEVLF